MPTQPSPRARDLLQESVDLVRDELQGDGTPQAAKLVAAATRIQEILAQLLVAGHCSQGGSQAGTCAERFN